MEDSKPQRQLELNSEVYWKSNCTKLLRTPLGEGETGRGGMTAAPGLGKGGRGVQSASASSSCALVSSC